MWGFFYALAANPTQYFLAPSLMFYGLVFTASIKIRLKNFFILEPLTSWKNQTNKAKKEF